MSENVDRSDGGCSDLGQQLAVAAGLVSKQALPTHDRVIVSSREVSSDDGAADRVADIPRMIATRAVFQVPGETLVVFTNSGGCGRVALDTVAARREAPQRVTCLPVSAGFTLSEQSLTSTEDKEGVDAGIVDALPKAGQQQDVPLVVRRPHGGSAPGGEALLAHPCTGWENAMPDSTPDAGAATRLSRLRQLLEHLIFRGPAADALARGWEVHRSGRFRRTYRDPRWQSIVGCDDCQGNGLNATRPCPTCDGRGTVRLADADAAVAR